MVEGRESNVRKRLIGKVKEEETVDLFFFFNKMLCPCKHNVPTSNHDPQPFFPVKVHQRGFTPDTAFICDAVGEVGGGRCSC